MAQTSKFLVKKKLDLTFLGEGWGSAFITFSGLTFKESRGFAGKDFTNNPNSDDNLNFVISLLQDHFLDGQVPTGEAASLGALSKEDIEELPVEVIGKAVELLVGGPDANLPRS